MNVNDIKWPEVKRRQIAQSNAKLKSLAEMFKPMDSALYALEIYEGTVEGEVYYYISIGDEIGFDFCKRITKGKTNKEIYDEYAPRIQQIIDRYYLKNI